MTSDSSTLVPTSVAPSTARRLAMSVLGVGGAGMKAVGHMARLEFPGVSFAAVHTNEELLQRCGLPRAVQIGARITRGFSAAGDPDVGRAAAEQDSDPLRDLFQGVDLVFVVAGLGGGTGTGAAPVVARLAKEAGALVLALVTLPFDFEGARRRLQAAEGLEALRATADGLICLPNQKVLEMLDEHTRAVDAFRTTHELLAEAVRSLGRLLTTDGLIHIDFADLARVLRGSHTASVFATAEAQGPQRAREVVDRLLASPLLEGGQSLSQADDVLVSILGSADLTMAEIHQVMDRVRQHAEDAHLLLGAAVSDSPSDHLAVTLIASIGSDGMVSRLTTASGQLTGASRPAVPSTGAPELHDRLLSPTESPRPPSRFVAPAPELSDAQKLDLLAQQGGGAGRARRMAKWRQGQLPLEIVSRGRFEKSEPTLYRGQDLDVPTYVRRGIALN